MSETINLKAHFENQWQELVDSGRDPSTVLDRISKRLRSGKPLYRFYEKDGKQVVERLY